MKPTLDEFKQYAFTRIKAKKDDPRIYTDWLEDKYEAWTIAGWKKEQKGKFVDIKIWQTTLIQCLAHRIPNKVNDIKVRAEVIKPTGDLKRIEDTMITNGFNEYKIMSKLSLKYATIWDTLIERNLLPKAEEISPKTGKSCQAYYHKKFILAGGLILAELIDAKNKSKDKDRIHELDLRMEQVKLGNDPEVQNKTKCLVVEDYFQKFETEQQITLATN